MSLYDTRRWKRLRLSVLDAARWRCQWPGCHRPLRSGRSGKCAGVVDHKVPHKGDPSLFWDRDNLWALCKEHHDSAKQSEESRGYSQLIGADGMPVDPAHPCYRHGARARQ